MLHKMIIITITFRLFVFYTVAKIAYSSNSNFIRKAYGSLYILKFVINPLLDEVF